MTSCNFLPFVAHVVLFCNIASVACSDSKAGPPLFIKSKDGILRAPVQWSEGENFTATCIANKHEVKGTPKSMEWLISDKKINNPRMNQVWDGNFSVQLTISRVNRSDAQMYECLMVLDGDEERKKQLELHVKPSDEPMGVCGVTRFRCIASGICIFNRYTCDGLPDCPEDASDESEDLCGPTPCQGKFRCNNSRCVDRALVCDGADSCGDDSDEVIGCLLNSLCLMSTAPTTQRSLTDENEHFNWLKTTVYTVIGCTVATVILISFIVIIVFRVKMKRLRARRMAHQMERHRRHGDGVSDQDPFLAFNTQSHYGNIIVNVNNGVQCMGGGAIAAGFQREKPPPYSEVVHKTEIPPPPYSTIDRANRRQNGGVDAVVRASPGSLLGSGMAVVGPLWATLPDSSTCSATAQEVRMLQGWVTVRIS